MADPIYPNSPATFTFDGRTLRGQLVSFTTKNARRFVVHEFPKRKGALVEDMERGPRRIEVQLQFLGDTCAKDFADFQEAVDKQPRGLLIHPIAGRFQAFCEGPQEDVTYNRAIDQIQVRVAWIETQLDAQAVNDVPNVATATQNATNSQAQADVAVATFMGELAIAQSFTPDAQAVVGAAIAQISTVTAPVTLLRSTITSTAGIPRIVVDTTNAIADQSDVWQASMTAYIDSATSADIFDGEEIASGTSTSVNTLLGIAVMGAQDLEDAMLAAAVTPAGAADSVGGVEEATGAALILAEAVKASRPPTVLYTVPELTDLITLAQKKYGSNALGHASEIMGLNRIPNPAAIPAGTRLLIPTR